jgi:hypothetical protein
VRDFDSLIKRFLGMFRRLASAYEGERVAAAHAIYRFCTSAEGISISDLALMFEGADHETKEKKYTDEDAAAIYARGIEKGRDENRGVVLSADYFNADGEPRWAEIARFCHESPVFLTLKPNEQDVIENTPTRLARYGSLTRPTEGFLLSIFWKLGGSFK